MGSSGWFTPHRLTLAGLCSVAVLQAAGPLASPIFGDEIPIVRNVLHFAEQRTLVPLQFNYPTFFSYLLAAWTAIVALASWAFTGQHPVDFAFGLAWSIGGSFELGRELAWLRALSVVLTVALVLATYRLGREAWGRTVGLGAAAMVVASRTLAERSAWLLPDVLVAVLVTLVGILSLRHLRHAPASRQPVTRGLLIAAGLSGMAVATKYNGGLAFALVLAAWGLGLRQPGLPGPSGAFRLAGQAARLGGVALAAVVACLPALVVAADQYWEKFRWEARHMGEGQILVDLGEYPYAWIAMRLWSVEGLLGGLLFLMLPALALLRRERAAWVLGLPVLLGIAVVGGWRYTSLHYLLWALPLASVITLRGLQRVTGGRRAGSVVAGMLVAVALMPGAFTSLRSSVAALRTPANRVQAERWVEATVPAGARVDQDWYALPTLWDLEVAGRFEGLLAAYPRELAARAGAVRRKPVFRGNLGYPPEPPEASRLREDRPTWVITSSETEPPTAEPLPGYRAEHLDVLHRRLHQYYQVLRSGHEYQVVATFNRGNGPDITVYRLRPDGTGGGR